MRGGPTDPPHSIGPGRIHFVPCDSRFPCNRYSYPITKRPANVKPLIVSRVVRVSWPRGKPETNKTSPAVADHEYLAPPPQPCPAKREEYDDESIGYLEIYGIPAGGTSYSLTFRKPNGSCCPKSGTNIAGRSQRSTHAITIYVPYPLFLDGSK